MSSRRELSKDTRLCVSLSARPGNFGTRFQNFLYRELDLDFAYKAFAIQDIAGAVAGIRALGIRGAAISMPFKETCMPLLDAIDPAATAIGAVNTIVNGDGRLVGYNTDYAAVASLLRRSGLPKTAPFALLGSGGMAKAVAAALRDEGFVQGTIVARNRATGSALAARLGFAWAPDFPSLSGAVSGGAIPRLLVNASPIGMAGGAEAAALAFPREAIARADLVFDVVAVPPETPLVLAARATGKSAITGTDVIVLQAVEQFVLYTGIRPEAALVQRAAEYAFARSSSPTA